MKTDKTEIAATARKFRLDESLLQSLQKPGDALVNFADTTEWQEIRIGNRKPAENFASLLLDN